MNPLQSLYIALSEAVRDSPRLYPLWLRARSGGRRARLPSPSSDLHVAGFPRSGNTYAWRLLEETAPDLRVARHLHSLASIRLALRLGVPTVVLVRDPVEAVSSYLVRRQASPDHDALLARLMRRWVRFHRYVERVRHRVAVLPFTDLRTDAWTLIRAASSVMPSPLPVTPGDARQAAERVLDRMRERQRHEPPRLSSLPDETKERLKAAHRLRVEQHALAGRAASLYRRLTGTPEPTRILFHFLGLRTGGGRTTALNLLNVLPRMAPEHRFLALVPAGYGYENLSLPDNCRLSFEPVRRWNDLRRLWLDNVSTPRQARRFGADVVFSLGNLGPLWLEGTTRHVVLLQQPQLAYPLRHIARMGASMTRSLASFAALRLYFQLLLLVNTDELIVQTETMRRRVTSLYRVPCPVHVVGRRLSAPLRTQGDGRPSPSLLPGDDDVFRLLYVSFYYPHKNIERLCSAVGRLRRRGVEIQLVLTLEPGDHPAAARLLKRIDADEFAGGVVSIGRLDLADLAAVYGAVDVVITSSLLESYSANYVEAFAFGKPLLASDRDFAREVCADAALYFDPLDESAIGEAVTRVMTDRELREQLARRSSQRWDELQLSWEELGSRYLAVIAPAAAAPAAASAAEG